ncbi:MAG: acyl-CoA dehydrogenase family protein, partial [Novosphingobium meiothermophilum]
MNFDLTEDEEMLKALAERFVADHYDLDRRRTYLAGANGFSPEMWAMLAELGLVAAPLSEESGGLALDATAIATVFEALGRGLVVEPLIENIMVAARLFERVASDDLKAQWME